MFLFCSLERVLNLSCKNQALTSPLVVQSLSCVRLFATPWTAVHQASLSITISWSLLKLMSTESVMPSSHLVLCRPLLLLPSVFPSIKIFCSKSALCIRWPKYWCFSFSISPSSEYSGLISFTINWFVLLAVQQTLKSLLQHYSLKVSVLQCSALLSSSHVYTWLLEKNIVLTKCTFVGEVMSLLFNMLFMFVISFLSRSKGLLMSRLQSMSTVTFCR